MQLRNIIAALALASLPITAFAADPVEFDPETVDPADVISCKISAAHYTGFVMTLTTSGEPGSFETRGWEKVDSGNPFMTQYQLPKPITVYGYTTSDVAFTSTAMLAVIDLADPAALAKAQNIENLTPASGRFIGEREISNASTVDKEAGFTIKESVTINISTVTSHPGKTMIGCSYNLDMEPLES